MQHLASAEGHFLSQVALLLELGGKGPQVVFADADVDAAIPAIINAIVQNSGQTCSAGSRLLIEQSLYEPLLAKLGAAFNALRVGPAAMDLDLGPLIRKTQQERVQGFLAEAAAAKIGAFQSGSRPRIAPMEIQAGSPGSSSAARPSSRSRRTHGPRWAARAGLVFQL